MSFSTFFRPEEVIPLKISSSPLDSEDAACQAEAHEQQLLTLSDLIAKARLKSAIIVGRIHDIERDENTMKNIKSYTGKDISMKALEHQHQVAIDQLKPLNEEIRNLLHKKKTLLAKHNYTPTTYATFNLNR